MMSQSKTTALPLKATSAQGKPRLNFKYALYRRVIIETLLRLNPRRQIHNPVMSVLAVLGILTIGLFLWTLVESNDGGLVFTGAAAVCLWVTVLFVNFAEALAGGYVQVRAEALRRVQAKNTAKKLSEPDRKDDYDIIPATSLNWGDVVLVEAGDIIPADGEVIEGLAQIDESILTGASTPVVREVKNNHSAVSGGACVLSGWLVIGVKAKPGQGVLDQMLKLVEETRDRLPKYKDSLKVLLVDLAVITLFVILIRFLYADLDAAILQQKTPGLIILLVALLAALIPTVTSGGLLDLIDLAGLDRLIRRNVIALSDRAVEAAVTVDVLFLNENEVMVSNHQAEGMELKDKIRQGLREHLVRLRSLGVETILITGDMPDTAVAIAAEAGADDFLAQATAQTKLKLLNRYQAQGHRVAITGDGLDDSSLMVSVDLAVAAQSSTRLAREVADMINLDDNPDGLLEIVEMGKQRLLTSRALTVFSLANDVTKYFVVLPAVFGALFPALDLLNFMRLDTPASAILAALIFNTLSIGILMPLALWGLPYQLIDSAQLRRVTLLACGLGGIIAPFVGIKVIDLTLAGLGLV